MCTTTKTWRRIRRNKIQVKIKKKSKNGEDDHDDRGDVMKKDKA